MSSPRSRLAALALLLALGASLAAGPQPCQAGLPPRPAAPATQAMHASHDAPAMPGMGGGCHRGSAPSGPALAVGLSAPAGGGCCGHGATPAERLQCERSCALAAVLTDRPAPVALGPVASLAPMPVPDTAPLFAPAIDHIPL
jgi:hypothetical protein